MFREKGSEILKKYDQDYHDLDKSINHLHQLIQTTATSSPSMEHIVIVCGGFGGRFDQEIANLHSLYRWSKHFHHFLFLDESNITCLLSASSYHIFYPLRSHDLHIYEGKYCGLLPIGSPVQSITTTGLEWNLTNESLMLGQRISSSNTIPQDIPEITIDTSEDIVFTCSYTLADKSKLEGNEDEDEEEVNEVHKLI